MINELETNLITALVLGEITEQEFLRRYPVNLNKNKNYLIDLIDKSIKNRDSDVLDILLDAVAALSIYEDYDNQSIYRKLVREDWHQMHEELIDSLDKTHYNEDCFIHVLNQVYDYYKNSIEDFMVPIWSKCLWSLYAIKTQKAIDTIRTYSDSKYEYLKNTSNKLLSKLNE